MLSLLSHPFLFTTWQVDEIFTQLTCLDSLGSFTSNFYSSSSSMTSSSSSSSCDAHAEQLHNLEQCFQGVKVWPQEWHLPERA